METEQKIRSLCWEEAIVNGITIAGEDVGILILVKEDLFKFGTVKQSLGSGKILWLLKRLFPRANDKRVFFYRDGNSQTLDVHQFTIVHSSLMLWIAVQYPKILLSDIVQVQSCVENSYGCWRIPPPCTSSWSSSKN